MKKITTFGLQYAIELEDNQQITIEDITYFPQYKGHTVEDVYAFLEMDPWNEDIFEVYENEISGDELDLMYPDFQELSYRGKAAQLERDEDLKREYELGLIDDSEISEGSAFDFIWECQSEDEEWQEKYLQFLETSIKENTSASKKIKKVLAELLENAKNPMRDNIVLIVYRIGLK